MTIPSFQYPVLGINRRPADWGQGEYFREFRDERAITICDGWALKNGARIGMLLIDNAGRNWEIRSMRRLRAAGSLVGKVIKGLFGQQEYHVELDLIEAAPLSFDEVKARLCKSIDDNPDDWRDDEAIAGEDGPPRDEQEMLEELKAKVRGARTLAELLDKVDASE